MRDSLAQSLSETRGGIYYFAGNGEYLEKFVAHGDTRLSPFGYDFKASITFRGFPVNPRLVRAYGVNENPNETRGPVINIPTLKFSDAPGGGGGIILVYDTNPQ